MTKNAAKRHEQKGQERAARAREKQERRLQRRRDKRDQAEHQPGTEEENPAAPGGQ